MKARTLKITGLFILALLFASSPAIAQADCDLQKVVVKQPKKKKKKKKGDPEVISKPRIIETDTSKICPTYTTANIDKEILADKFINMALLSMSSRHEMAFKNWECIYNNAPGYSILVYTSGAEIYVDRAKKAKEDGDDAKVEEYGTEALRLLEEGGKCFQPEEEFYGVRAYVYEILWPNKNDEIYGLYKAYLDFKGDNADSHTLKRATQYALHMHYGLDKITEEVALEIAHRCKDIADAKKNQQEFAAALEEIDYYLEYYAGLKEKAIEQAEQKAQSTQNSALKDADVALRAAVKSINGSASVTALDKYIAASSNAANNFKMAMYVGQNFIAKDNVSARSAFRKAMQLDPSSGEPEYFIGRMYLGAGADCGPGTGFDSQRVLWAAYDKFNVAKGKTLSSESLSFINEQMATYKQYLPTAAQIQAEGLSVGQTYTIPCWINETTSVRLP